MHRYGCGWFILHRLSTHAPDHTWVAINGITAAPQYEQYIYALYKAAAILVAFGYGNVPPTGAYEVGYTLCGLLGGVVMLALLTASIVSITAQLNETDREAQMRLRAIQEFLAAENCPLDLRQRVRKHMEYVLTGGAASTQKALDGLSHPLRAEIALFRCRDLVQRVPFLSSDANPDPGFIKRLVLQLRREAFSPGDRMMEEGEVAMSMYFVASGSVGVYVSNGARRVTTLSQGKQPTPLLLPLPTPPLRLFSPQDLTSGK